MGADLSTSTCCETWTPTCCAGVRGEERGSHSSLIDYDTPLVSIFDSRERSQARSRRPRAGTTNAHIRGLSPSRRSHGGSRVAVGSVGDGDSGGGQAKPTSGIRFEGHVRKRGHINPAFQPRFFVLTDDELRYYKTEDTSHDMQGRMLCIDMATVQASPASVQGTFEFTVTDSHGRSLVCSVPTEDSQQAWIQQILAARSRLGSPSCARSPARGSSSPDMGKRGLSPARLTAQLQHMVESLHHEVQDDSFEGYMKAKCEHNKTRSQCKVRAQRKQEAGGRPAAG